MAISGGITPWTFKANTLLEIIQMLSKGKLEIQTLAGTSGTYRRVMWQVELSQSHIIPGLLSGLSKSVVLTASPLHGSPLMFHVVRLVAEEIPHCRRTEFRAITGQTNIQAIGYIKRRHRRERKRERETPTDGPSEGSVVG